MSNVSIRDLHSRGGHVLNQISRGETLIVTRRGKPVAELRPLDRAPLTAEALVARWRWLPHLDADALKADTDKFIDPTLWLLCARDTSVVIALPTLESPEQLPAGEPLITTITLAELSVGPLVARTEAERAARQAHLQQAVADFLPLPFDASAARAFGSVAACLRQTGRKTSTRSYDAMIAATALANGLPIYTCNPDDFTGIDGLEVMRVEFHSWNALVEKSSCV